ncbi:MAG: hypothetical protein HYZ36_03650 [Pedosphaera parvula]|nr:hypothetical protein [Pedosphaera parvula]
MVARFILPLPNLIGTFLAVFSLALTAAAQAPRPPADAWVTNFVQFPPGTSTNSVHHQGFENLHAEALAGSLRVSWQPVQMVPGATATVLASADDLGHWPARDWRRYPMAVQRDHWAASLPVDNLEVPVVYFVEQRTSGSTNVSLMRVCHPRRAGLSEPSRVFWPFLDGFEEGIEGWWLVGTPTELPPLNTDPTAKNGRAALRVKVPPNKRSMTLATTRVRGWQILQQTARGVRLWLRTKAGSGKARFTLLANAYTSDQSVSVCATEPVINEQWQKVDLAFSLFPKVPLADVDLLTIEFIGQGPLEFLVDDLQLLGRWRMEVE